MQNHPDYVSTGYTIGSGALLLGDSASGPWTDTIHIKDFKCKIETDKQEIKSSRHGLKKLAATITKEIKGMGSFICDYPHIVNLLNFLMGENSVITQAGATVGPGAEPVMVAKLGKWVSIGGHRDLSNVVVKCVETDLSAGVPAADLGNAGDAVLGNQSVGASAIAGSYTIAYDTDHYTLEDPDGGSVTLFRTEGTDDYTSSHLNFSVTSGAPVHLDSWTCAVTGTPSTATLTITTDYLLDTDRGLVLIKSDNTKSVVDDTVLKVTYTYGTYTYNRIKAGVVGQIRKHVWFIGDPTSGIKQEIKGYASLNPTGELALIGDVEQEFTVDISFEQNASYSGAENALFFYEDHGVAS